MRTVMKLELEKRKENGNETHWARRLRTGGERKLYLRGRESWDCKLQWGSKNETGWERKPGQAQETRTGTKD